MVKFLKIKHFKIFKLDSNISKLVQNFRLDLPTTHFTYPHTYDHHSATSLIYRFNMHQNSLMQLTNASQFMFNLTTKYQFVHHNPVRKFYTQTNLVYFLWVKKSFFTHGRCRYSYRYVNNFI